MGIDDYLAIVILIGVFVTFIVCAWMIKDLWDDRKVLKANNEHGASMIYNTRDIRNDIIRILKGVAIFIIFYPMVFILLDLPTHQGLLKPEDRVIPVRICAIVVVWFLPLTAIWDRVSRIEANRKILEEDSNESLPRPGN